MREILLDIVKHTNGLGIIDTVKITGSDTVTKIDAMDAERTVIINGSLLTVKPELDGEFGLSHLNLLQGLLNYPNFKADDAKISLTRRERNGRQTPEEIVFRDAQGQSANHRLMSAELIPQTAQFLGSSWDVEVEPSRSKIQEFSSLAGLFSSFENYFLVKTVRNDEEGTNELRFYIGDEGSSSHRTFLIMEADVKGELKGDLYWPISQVLSILKLGAEENTKLSINSRGALKISMASHYAQYDFILPARKK